MSFSFSFDALLLLSWRVVCLFGVALVGFASRIPTWCLPADGHVADLVTVGSEEVGVVRVVHGAPAVVLAWLRR